MLALSARKLGFGIWFMSLLAWAVVASAADDAYEDNDTFSTAKAITAGTYSLVALDEDYFKITTVNPGNIYIKLQYPTGSGVTPLHMILKNSSDQDLVANWTQDGTETILYHIFPQPATYYIRVLRAATELTNTYTLTVAFTYDAGSGDDSNDSGSGNDSIDMAVSLPAMINTVSNQKAYDDDWFKVTLIPGTFTVNLNFTTADGDIEMELYNSSYVRVAESIAATTAQTSFGRQMTWEVNEALSGTYYIAVFAQSGQSYSLTTDHPTVWATTLAYGPIRTASVALYDIDGDGQDEIFVGTSKGLDSSFNEIKPAGFVCLEADGTVKWTKTFAAYSGADPQTGKTYVTSSIGGRPAFADIDGDGQIDIVVPVGGDVEGEAGTAVIGQPGDLGGVYALNADGSTKWFAQAKDTIGGTSNTGEGRPDGVFSSPIVADLDRDGIKEVIFGGWDQYVYAVDGRDGSTKWSVHVLDTIWASPFACDLDLDGSTDILMSADITENADAQTQTGGVFHVFDKSGKQSINGYNLYFANLTYPTLQGKWEEQPLWSSPTAADIDGDGYLEVVYGTGNYFHDSRGMYIRVREHDGTEKYQLTTSGRTFASPLVADLDGDGTMEIVATTLEGYCYAWNYNGAARFATKTVPFGSVTGTEPIFSSPLAVDLDGDGKLEIVYAQATQIVIVSSDGVQLSDSTKREMVFESFKGSPAVSDIDGDSRLEIVSGGTNAAKDTGVVYCYRYGDSATNGINYRYGRRQFLESTIMTVEAFVTRFYQECLSRSPDAVGLAGWTADLMNQTRSGANVAESFINSQEFINRGTSNTEYVTILYNAFFARSPDAGLTTWVANLDSGTMTRAQVLSGFTGSTEFSNLANRYGISATRTLNSTAGDQVEKFVMRFYNNCLNRVADSAGLAAWAGELKAGTKKGGDVARAFIGSVEFDARGTSNYEYVLILYRAFFDREPGAEERDAWVHPLNGGTATRAQTLDGFIGAAEFSNLCATYGIAP